MSGPLETIATQYGHDSERSSDRLVELITDYRHYLVTLNTAIHFYLDDHAPAVSQHQTFLKDTQHLLEFIYQELDRAINAGEMMDPERVTSLANLLELKKTQCQQPLDTLHVLTEQKVQQLGLTSLDEYRDYLDAYRQKDLGKIRLMDDLMRQHDRQRYEPGQEFAAFAALKHRLNQLVLEAFPTHPDDVAALENNSLADSLRKFVLTSTGTRIDAAHTDLAAHQLANTEVTTPTAVLLAGIPGSGKSILYETRFAAIPGVVNIDPDLYKPDIADWVRSQPEIFSDLNFSADHLEKIMNDHTFEPFVRALHEISSRYAKELQRQTMDQQLPFVDQGTLTNQERYIQLMIDALAHGYNVSLNYCFVEEDIALQRIVRNRPRGYPPYQLINASRGLVTLQAIRDVVSQSPLSIQEHIEIHYFDTSGSDHSDQADLIQTRAREAVKRSLSDHVTGN